MDALSLIIFLTSAIAISYTFVGYALHTAVLARCKSAKSGDASAVLSCLPEITVVLASYNEGSRIRARVENLLASDYPATHLRVLVVSDGSTDDTAVQIPVDPRVLLLARSERSGKPSCLNAGVAAATTDIIVFADARQQFEPTAIRVLAQRFSDPVVGAVSGALEIVASGSNTGAGVDIYWRLEKWIRSSESQIDSAIGCTGAIYAIRRALFKPIPPDTVLDDVVIPMQIVTAGFRVLFEPLAVAWDPQPLEPEAERRRKTRTLAGNFQMLFRYPVWLNPRRNRLWWPLFSHKYLRLFAPAFLLLAFASNALLLDHGVFRAIFALQGAFYFLAASARVLPRTKLAAIPAGFVFLNLMTIFAFWHFLSNRKVQQWEPLHVKSP